MYITVLYHDSYMLDSSMITLLDYTCVARFYMLSLYPLFFYHSLRSLLTTVSMLAQVLIQRLFRSRSTSSTLLIFS